MATNSAYVLDSNELAQVGDILKFLNELARDLAPIQTLDVGVSVIPIVLKDELVGWAEDHIGGAWSFAASSEDEREAWRNDTVTKVSWHRWQVQVAKEGRE